MISSTLRRDDSYQIVAKGSRRLPADTHRRLGEEEMSERENRTEGIWPDDSERHLLLQEKGRTRGRVFSRRYRGLHQGQPISLEVTGKDRRVAALIDAHFTLWSDIKRQKRHRPILFDDIRTLNGPVSQPVFATYTQMFKQLRAFLFSDDALPAMSRGDRNARTHLVLSSMLWLPGWLPSQEIEDYPFSSKRIADLLLYGVAAPGWECNDAAVTIPMPEPGPKEAFLQAAASRSTTMGTTAHR